MNYTRPPLAITIEPIRSALTDTKRRGVKLRYLTEITKDNISYCKKLMEIVDELRHLDGIKGNFMVSEIEYLAPVILFEKGKVASQIVYSNVKELVEQQHYTFDSFWRKAIPASQRIREMEEGIVSGGERYQTRLLETPEEVADEIKRTINRLDHNDWSICSTFDALSMMTYNKDFEMQVRVLESSRRGNNTRWVGIIDEDKIKPVKTFIDLGMKIKHIKSMPPMNFAVSSKEMYATLDEMKGGQIAKNLLISNEPLYVKHFKSIFEDLWKNGIDAMERIKDVEQGVDLADIEVIRSSARAQELYLDIVRSAKEEVLWIFPTFNAFIRQEKIGAILLAKEKNVKIRILVPFHKSLEDTMQKLNLKEERYPTGNSIDAIRYIEQMSETKATILVVDRKVSLVMELKDDTKSTFHGAIGLSTYSNSKAGVLSYVAIFENLWRQAELYQQVKESNEQLAAANEQLKVHGRMQREFIDIAAHELRTPIQPILGLTQVISSRVKDREEAELLKVVSRNAKRLQQLTEDLLDVTKIESNSLVLNKERFNLNEVISNTIDDITANLGSFSIKKKEDIRIFYEPHNDKNKNIIVEADKARISQVISNLLNNAVKFTAEEEGESISVTLEENKDKDNDHHEVSVKVKDEGIGIDTEIMPRLFTKFASKSEKGTGLGLFISKSIIEAHGGRIWAENNADGIGATLTFTLPIASNDIDRHRYQ